MERDGTARRIDMLDLLKCLAVYGVVLIHIRLPGPAGTAAECLARAAVPLFFLSAGFFSYGRPPGVLLRRAGRTLRLLLFSCAALLALGCVLAKRSGESIAAYIISRFAPGLLRDVLLFQLIPLPYAWALWFLAALLPLYLLWWLLTAALRERIPCGALALLAVLLLAVHLSLGEGRLLLGLEPLENQYIRNLWLDGFPFFTLGAWMKSREAWWAARPPRLLWGGAVLGLLLALAERKLAGQSMDLFLGAALAAVLLLTAAVRTPRVGDGPLRRAACFCGRELTFYIFAFHVPIYGIFVEWQGEIPAFGWLLSHPWLTPFAAAALSTLLALALNWGAARLRPRKRSTT